MTKKHPLVTVIVPVYNAEVFIRTCIESILMQDYVNIELVLIDDGSKDDSGSICDEYANVDSRIKVFHQKNGGVSAARNRGIDLASGEFITFVDSDDTITKDAISVMTKYASSGVDVVRTNYLFRRNRVEKTGKISVPTGLYEREGVNRLIQEVIQGGILGYTWLLMIRTSLLKDENIIFDTSLSMMEDTKFYVDLFAQCKSVYVSNDITYVYVVSDISASRNADNYRRNIADVIKLNTYFKRNFKHKLPNLDKDIDSVHVISMASQIASTIEFPRPAYAIAASNIKWLQKNSFFNQFYENADLSNTSIYSRLVLFFIKRKLVFMVLTLFTVRGLIRKFI